MPVLENNLIENDPEVNASPYIINVGDDVKIKDDFQPSIYRNTNPPFTSSMDSLIGLTGNVRQINRRIVRVLFVEKYLSCDLDINWVIKVNKNTNPEEFKEGDILVAENKELKFRGIFILKNFMNEYSTMLRYLIMSSNVEGVNYIHVNNKLGHEVSIYKAGSEDVAKLYNDIKNHTIYGKYTEKYSIYFNGLI